MNYFNFMKGDKIGPRELEVVQLVCEAYTINDIAKKLKIKPGTVKTHLRSIYSKVRIHTGTKRMALLLRFLKDLGKG